MSQKDERNLDDIVRQSIEAIRYALAHTAFELKGLKSVRHNFDAYSAEQYAMLKRRATMLHVALRTNRLSLHRGDIKLSDFRPHCTHIALDGPWLGERHRPIEPTAYKHRTRPSRTREPQKRTPPQTQPAMLALTESNIVGWTRLVNNWATCCGHQGRVFHLDVSVDTLVRRSAINRRQREHALKELAKAERNAASAN